MSQYSESQIILKQQIMRRLRALFLSAFIVTGLAATLFVVITQGNAQQANREDGLSVISTTVEQEVASVVQEIISLSNGTFLRNYNILASEAQLVGSALGPFREAQRDMLRAFNDTMERYPNEFTLMRYITTDRRIWGEAVNDRGDINLDTLYRLLTDPDDTLIGILDGTIEEDVVLSAIKSDETSGNQPYTSIYVPMRDSNGDLQGVLQADFVLSRVFGGVQLVNNPASRFAFDQREIILMSSFGTELAFSNPETGVNTRALYDAYGIFLDEASSQLWDGYLITTTSIQPYEGGEFPWRIYLVDNAVVAFRSPVLASLLLVLVVGLAWFGLYRLSDTLLERSLYPLAVASRQIKSGKLDVQTSDRVARSILAAQTSTNQKEPTEVDDLVKAITESLQQINDLNINLTDEVRRHNRSVEIAARIGRQMATLTDIDVLLNTTIDLITSELGFYHAQVFLTDDAGINAVLVYSHGEAGKKLIEMGHKLAVGSDTIIGAVTGEGRPVYVNDTQARSGPHGFNALLPDTRAEMGLPLVVGNQVIGALDIQSKRPDTFREEDLPLFGLLADQLAVAINKSNLLNEMDSRIDEIDRLNRQLTRNAWEEAEEENQFEARYTYNLLDIKEDTTKTNGNKASESEEVVPIVIRGEVIGSIRANSGHDIGFSEGDRMVLRAVSDRVALALENARLFHETQNVLHETSILYQLSRFLNEASTLRDIVQAITMSVVPDAGGAQVWIFGYENNSLPDTMTIQADLAMTEREPNNADLTGLTLNIADHPLLRSLTANNVTLVNNVNLDNRIDQGLKLIFRRMQAVSVVVIPLNVRGSWLGNIMIEFEEPRNFSERDGRIYTALIDQAGIAIDNRLLLEQTEEALARNENLYAASRIINTAQGYGDLIYAAVATSNFHELNFALILLEGELDEMGWPTIGRTVAISNQGSVEETEIVYPIRISAESPMRNREPEVIVDGVAEFKQEPSSIAWLTGSNEYSFVGMFPLFSSNQPIAIFCIISEEHFMLSNEYTEVYRAITGQMSTQLENRSLLLRTERSLDETRRLYLASRAISGAQDAAEIFHTTSEHLARPLLQQAKQIPQGFHISVMMARPEYKETVSDVEVVHVWSNDANKMKAIQKDQVIEGGNYNLVQLRRDLNFAARIDDIRALDSLDIANSEAAINLFQLNEARSVIITPIQSRGIWFGYIICQGSEPRAFDEQYERFVDALAGQIALSLENQRLFEEAQTEAKRAQLEARRALALAEAAQIANQVGGDTETERELDEVLRQVANASGFDRWTLTIYNETEDVLDTVVYNIPYIEGDDDDIARKYRMDEVNNLHIRAFLNDRSFIVNDLTTQEGFDLLPDYRQKALLEKLGKFIVVPIRLGGRVMGTLLTGRPAETDSLDDGDSRLVSTLAAQIAVAIENRRLFESARREQETLSSTLSTLPAGVLVLDPTTLKPVTYNDQAYEYLQEAIDERRVFNAENYHLYRTGTELFYPNPELPVFNAQKNIQAPPTDDVAIIRDDLQIDLLVNAAPIINSDGNVQAVVVTFSDISNLRSLENTLQENLRETVAIYEAQRQLSEAEELDQVLDTLIVQLAMMQPSEAYVLMLDDNNKINADLALISPLEGDLEILNRVTSPQSMRYITNIENTDLSEEEIAWFTERGMISIMTVPLRISSRIQPIGWLFISQAEPNGFALEQERIMTQLGDVASTAIDNRFLIRQTQIALQETDKLYSATTTISRARDAYQLRMGLETSITSLKSDMYAAFLTDENMFSEPIIAIGQEIPLLRAALSRHQVPDEGLYISDLEKLGEDATELERELQTASEEIRAIGVVNLRVKDFAGGRLVIGFKEPHPFEDSERRYMQSLSDSVSVVLDNISLVDEIQSTLEETTVLYQAVRNLTDAESTNDIMSTIVDYILQPYVDKVFIALLNTRTWDAPGASVDITASWSENEAFDLKGVSLNSDQFPAWRLLGTNSVLAIDDAENDDRLDDMERFGIESLEAKSVVIIPLRVPSRAIGVIWISSGEEHAFNDRELRIYQSFGEQASLSLEASYLLQQTERRARQLETSAEVSSTIGQILDLDTLFPRLVDLIRDAFGYDHVQIFMMDNNDEYAVLHASTGEAGRQLLEIKHKLAKGSLSVIGQVTENAEPTIALDTAHADVVHKPNPYLPLTRSEMALPIIIKGKTVGALDVQSNEPNAFSEEDVAVLTTLAAQISVAIDNANLYQASQSQADRMELLFEVTRSAAFANDVQSALTTVARQVHEERNALAVTVYIQHTYMDNKENIYSVLQAESIAGIDHPLSEIEIIDLAEDNPNKLSVACITGNPIIINNIAAEEHYLPIAQRAHSALLVPITTGNQMLGLIAIENERINAFDADETQLIQALASSLSAIVQSMQLLERLNNAVEELRELDRIKSDFLANMSHELRTPLNSIIGFSRVMLKGIDGPLTEMQEQDLTTIYNSGNHLLNLINDILDQAKIAAGKMDIKPDYIDINAVIDVVKSMTIGYMKDKDLQLHVEVAPNLPKVYGDEFRLRQILINLSSNAVKFTSEGGITIRAYKVKHPDTGKDFVKVDVQDSGIGIAEKDLPLLFEAFRQVDSSLTRTQGGTGLGLPIAKSLIEMQGGQMTVTSKVNHGSTFSITIPVEPPAIDKSEEEDATPIEITGMDDLTNGKNGKTEEADTRKTLETRAINPDGSAAPVMPIKRQILLIEDNPDMVDQFRRTLQREGFEVLAASIPLEAEAMASGLHPTLIVMDINFAKGQGWNILQNLKNRDDTFDIPVIVVTLSDEKDRAMEIGAFDFIQRPFVPEDLAKAALDAEQESNTQRILIIDDQPEAVRLLTEVLNEHGKYRVFSASNGQEGIGLVVRRRPDLIILDLRMPEMDGFAVLNELRSHPESASIPVMVVTGDVLNADEQNDLENVRVLQKTDISQEDYERFIQGIQDHLIER